jgi:hypothetical protein
MSQIVPIIPQELTRILKTKQDSISITLKLDVNTIIALQAGTRKKPARSTSNAGTTTSDFSSSCAFAAGAIAGSYAGRKGLILNK